MGLKLPTFWADNPETWFAQAESQFATRNITVDETKFHHVVAVLDGETAVHANTILLNPPATEKYKAIKDFLTSTYGLTEAERAEKLLTMDELGTRKPSKLMSTILHLYGPTQPSFLVKHIFLRALPEKLRQSLASVKMEDLRELAKEADRLAPMVERQVFQATDPGVDAAQRRPPKKDGLCFYHARFGARATRCRKPCTWSAGNGSANSQ